jgi:hypothetical protein
MLTDASTEPDIFGRIRTREKRERGQVLGQGCDLFRKLKKVSRVSEGNNNEGPKEGVIQLG